MPKFKTAKQKLITNCQEFFPEFSQDPDFEAIITHWLLSPNILPPKMPKKIFKQCKGYFDQSAQKKGISKQALREDHDIYQTAFNFKYDGVPFPPVKHPKFTFIDLFAGVGGIRMPFQELGGHCVFSSEWNEKSQITYSQNYGETPYGDITKISEKEIPDHDILLAGFPCQAFSIAGYREGFADKKGRGNLFFDIYRIIKEKKPKAFLLENVKNLKGHDKGNTFKVIAEYLNEAGYSVTAKVLNTMDYGNVPQNRERIYIIGFKDEAEWEFSDIPTCTSAFEWPEAIKLDKTVQALLEPKVDEYFYYDKYDCYEKLKESVISKDTVYQWRRMYVRENKKGVCPTLTANMGAGGHNVPIILDNKGIRKLTPRECFRIQGFPEKFELPEKMAQSHLYMQAGNSVSVPVVRRVAESILKAMGKKGVIANVLSKSA